MQMKFDSSLLVHQMRLWCVILFIKNVKKGNSDVKISRFIFTLSCYTPLVHFELDACVYPGLHRSGLHPIYRLFDEL